MTDTCPACGFKLRGDWSAPVDVSGLNGLPPRLRRLLRVLVTRWGRIVDHVDLSLAIWPGDDPERTKAGIRVRICELRKALAAANVPAEIVSIPTAGYQMRRVRHG